MFWLKSSHLTLTASLKTRAISCTNGGLRVILCTSCIFLSQNDLKKCGSIHISLSAAHRTGFSPRRWTERFGFTASLTPCNKVPADVTLARNGLPRQLDHLTHCLLFVCKRVSRAARGIAGDLRPLAHRCNVWGPLVQSLWVFGRCFSMKTRPHLIIIGIVNSF